MKRVITPFVPVCLAALVFAGCSGDDSASWDPETIEFGESQVFELQGESLSSNVSPAADRYASRGDEEVCIVALDADIDDTCGPREPGAAVEAGSWSIDGDGFMWTIDFARTFQEPDLSILEPATGDFDVITDDGVDELSNEDGTPLIDQGPFFGPDDQVYFFRTTDFDDPFELVRLDDDGEVEQVGRVGLPANSLVLSPPLRVDENRWAVSYQEAPDSAAGIAIVDVAEETIETIDVDEPSYLLDVGDSSALIVSVNAIARAQTDGAFSVVPLDGGPTRVIDADLADEEVLRAVGFSPDDSFVVAAVDARRSDPSASRLVGITLDEDDTIGDPSILLTVDDLPAGAGDDPSFGGVDLFGSIIWIDDGRLVFSTDVGRLVTIESTPG